MKCNAWVKYETVGKRKPYLRLTDCMTPYHCHVMGLPIPEGSEQCDGNVLPTIELETESGCYSCGCGSSSTMNVSFKCDKCGALHPEFPTSQHALQEFVREAFKNFTDEDRQKLLDKALKEKQANDRRVAKMRKEYEEREAERKKQLKLKREERLKKKQAADLAKIVQDICD